MVDFSAIAKWPNVPACYEWLSLDRRGRWRLQGEAVTHPGLIDFMNRQYASDEAGRWFVQNGPQRVFVDLLAAPWIFHLAADGQLLSHTRQSAGELRALFLDEDGSLWLDSDLGAGLLDDRDLATVSEQCCNSSGQPAGEADFSTLLAGRRCGLSWRALEILPLATVDREQRFNFIARPRAENPPN